MSKIQLLFELENKHLPIDSNLLGTHEILKSKKNPQKDVDLIFVDYSNLKRQFSKIEEIKKRVRPAFLPVLLLISQQELSGISESLLSVIDEIIVKPFHDIELQTRINLLLQLRYLSLGKQDWFRTTLYSIGDAVITTDSSGKVCQMNPVAEKLTGWHENEARGKPLNEIFHIVNEQTRVKVENPVQKVLNEKKRVNLANHTLLISRDGKEIPIADSGAPIFDANSKIIGCVLVFRDQTKERKAQHAIEHALQLAESIVNILREAALTLDAQLKVVSANRAFFKTFNLIETDVIGQPIFHLANGLFNLPDLRMLLEDILPQKGAFEDFAITHDFNSLGRRTILFNARKIQLRENSDPYIFLAMEDITERAQFEEALRESEERYRIIVENSHNGIFIIGDDYKFIYANNRLCEILGRSRQEIIGHDFREFLTKDSVDLVIERYRKRQRGEHVPSRYEFKVVRKDGQERTVEISSAIIKNSKGQVLTIAQIQDITEHRQAEQALIESEKKYRLIVENAHDGIEITQDDRIMFCNPRFAQMLGYSVDELKDIPFNKIYSEKAIKELYERQKKRQAGLPVPKRYKTTLKRKDGRLIDVEVSYEIIDYQGRPATFAIIRDISEQTRAQMELERLMTAIEQAAESILITDLTGKIQYVNPAFEKISGYRKEEAIGQTPRILKSGKHDLAFYENLWSTIINGQIWQGRSTNKRKNGELFTEEKTISPVRDAEGNITYFVAVGRDVSQQILLEQQLHQSQKMESIGRLAGGVAHDYNNMLTVILGNAQLGMSKMDKNNPFFDYFAKIHQAASRSAEITKQLLAFARKQTIEPKVLDLNDTIENMLKMLRRLIGEDIDLAWLPCSNLWTVKLDPSQVDQILVNLIVNARDAIQGVGKITIETENRIIDDDYCATHAGFTPGEFVMLAVSDNGCGMKKDILDKIFEPFFTTKETGKGTGLGLATVYGIVKQNNGFINVYSEPGKGSTFKIYIPKYKGKEKLSANRQDSVLLMGKGERILLVEDDNTILEFARNLLKELGYQVEAVSEPQQALELIKKSNKEFDLLLTDVIMPEMSGKELANQIKKQLPEIKVIFMSGYTANAIAHHGVLDKGINYLQKPFTIHQIASKLREVLD